MTAAQQKAHDKKMAKQIKKNTSNGAKSTKKATPVLKAVKPSVALKALAAVKPPLGVVPHLVHLYERYDDLYAAIGRYHKAGLCPNSEWFAEMKQISRKIHKST